MWCVAQALPDVPHCFNPFTAGLICCTSSIRGSISLFHDSEADTVENISLNVGPKFVNDLRIQVLGHLMLCPLSGSHCFEGTWCQISEGQGTGIIIGPLEC